MNALPLLLVGALPVALAAQAPAPPAGFDLRLAHGIVRDDAGTQWLIGHDYKAALRDGAMQFVPALGSRVPHDLPLTFRLASITRGAAALHEPGGETPVPLVDDRGVTFARGAIIERYEARVDGVEQSFVFAERPAGTGDLVVRGRLTSELVLTHTSGGALCFTDGVHGGVSIGAVTGIGARGERCAGTADVVDGMLELRLPSAFVDAASYPLVLDPLFGASFLAGSASADDSDVDASYEETFGTYLVVWRRSFSATDQDVRAQRVGNDGTLTGSALSITLALTNEVAPAVAAVNARNGFVVCWQEAPSPFGPWNVRARSVDAQTGAMSTTVTVGASAGDDVDPAISGDRSQTGDDALVVWEARGTGILARPVQMASNGTLTPGATQVVHNLATWLEQPVELSKCRLPNGIAVVSWGEFNVIPELRARAVDYAGNPLGGIVSLQFPGAPPHALDGDGTQFVAALSGASTVAVRPITWNGVALNVGAAVTIASATSPPAIEVAFLGERCLVAWQQPTANPFDSEVRGVAVKPDCTVCGQQFTVGTVARPNQRAPAVATHFAASSSLQEALLVWDETDSVPPFQGSVVGQRFFQMVGTPPVQLDPPCAGGGTAGTNGPFAPGNGSFRFTLSGGDPVAPFAILSLGTGDAPIACGCTFTNPLATFLMAAAAGEASHPFAVPCDPQFLGFQIEFQWLLWGAAASPCPLVPDLVASSRMLVTLTE